MLVDIGVSAHFLDWADTETSPWAERERKGTLIILCVFSSLSLFIWCSTSWKLIDGSSASLTSKEEIDRPVTPWGFPRLARHTMQLSVFIVDSHVCFTSCVVNIYLNNMNCVWVGLAVILSLSSCVHFAYKNVGDFICFINYLNKRIWCTWVYISFFIALMVWIWHTLWYTYSLYRSLPQC